jgi:hypothetical protein
MYLLLSLVHPSSCSCTNAAAVVVVVVVVVVDDVRLYDLIDCPSCAV